MSDIFFKFLEFNGVLLNSVLNPFIKSCRRPREAGKRAVQCLKQWWWNVENMVSIKQLQLIYLFSTALRVRRDKRFDKRFVSVRASWIWVFLKQTWLSDHIRIRGREASEGLCLSFCSRAVTGATVVGDCTIKKLPKKIDVIDYACLCLVMYKHVIMFLFFIPWLDAKKFTQRPN